MNYVRSHHNYPDWCRIYYSEPDGAENQFADDDEREEMMHVLYDGECIKYGSSQMRKFANGSVIKADHCVDIPYVIHGIHSGHRIDVCDAQGQWHDIEIVVAYADTTFGLGTTVFFNVTFN